MKFPKIFARNQEESAGLEEWKVSNYPLEAERVLDAVTYAYTPDKSLCAWETTPEPLGTYVAWMPVTSVFMETALDPQYSDIATDLSRIESRVVFNA